MYCKFCQHYVPSESLPVFASTSKFNGTCALAVSTDGEPDVDTSLAFAKDYEDYHAHLCVSADFGCVQFVLRTPPSSTAEKQNEELNHYGP